MTDPAPHCSGRRKFCKGCIGTMSAASAAMVGYPVLAFLGPPVRLDASKPVEVALDELATGQAKYVEFQGEQMIVLAAVAGPIVFSASCPHLGCNVVWDTADSMFRCPCHGAIFGPDGQVVSGPVSGGLKQVPFEVKDGKLIVS
jgi:Rieske Fe-S protein